MQDMEPAPTDHRETSKPNRLIVILAIVAILSLMTASIAIIYAWKQKQDQVDAGQITAEQVKRVCEEDALFRRENPSLCDNAKEVVKDDPEVQEKEIDDPDPNDPDPNDPDPFDDPDPDNPEKQQSEVQNDETQDSDPNDPDPVDDADPNDPDPDDPDPNDPDPDDPDPAAPGTWTCPGDQYMVGFTRENDGSITLNCQPVNNGGGPPQP